MRLANFLQQDALVVMVVWSKYSNAQRVSSLQVYRHHERNHPGKENLLLFPTSNQLPQPERKVHSRERLGKLLHFYIGKPHEYFDLTGIMRKTSHSDVGLAFERRSVSPQYRRTLSRGRRK